MKNWRQWFGHASTVKVWGLLWLCQCLNGYGCWRFLLQPGWRHYHAYHQQSHRLQQQTAQAKHWLAQQTRLHQQQQRLLTIDAAPFLPTFTALAAQNHVFVTHLQQNPDSSWQIGGTSSWPELQPFLVQLWQQALNWAVHTIDLKQNPHSLEWQLTWQSQSPMVRPVCSKPLPSPGFQALYSVTQIQWLGVIQDTQHSRGLISFPNHQQQLVSIGDVLGREQWRLVKLTPSQADFLDGHQQAHQLMLHLNSPE